jgi:hypothetical protein
VVGPGPARVAGLVALVLATFLLHLRFVVLDSRLPEDLGVYFARVPELVARPSPGVIVHVGGWYELVVALVLRAAGGLPWAFGVVLAVQVAACVALAAAWAWSPERPWAAMACGLLTASLPAVAVLGRTGWIHVPETALLLGAAVALRGTSVRATLAAAALGGLAVAMRPSALAWLAILATTLRGRRAWYVAAAWAIGAVPFAVEGRAYVAAKVLSRARYADVVAGPWVAWPEATGVLPLLLAGWGMLRAGRPDRVLAAWTALPLLLWVAFRAGIDNFTPGFVAMAAWAARGLGPGGAVAAGTAWALFAGGQLLPRGWGEGSVARVAAVLRLPVEPGLMNLYVPFTAWSPAEIRLLADSTCPPDSCRIGTIDGLFRPVSEDLGRFSLFLSGERRAKVVDLRAEPAAVDAVVTWVCDDVARAPAPEALGNLRRVGASLTPIWGRRIGVCTVGWYASGATGPLPHSADLPPPPLEAPVEPMPAPGERSGRPRVRP